jgi:hypothetical protein
MKLHTVKTDQAPQTISEVCGENPSAFQQMIERKDELLRKMEDKTDKRIRNCRAAQWATAA